MSPEQERWVDAVLRNDENSSDAELVEYFVEGGLTQEQAAAAVATRDSKLGQI